MVALIRILLALCWLVCAGWTYAQDQSTESDDAASEDGASIEASTESTEESPAGSPEESSLEPQVENPTEAAAEPTIESTPEPIEVPTIAPMTLTLQVHPIFPPEQADLVYAPLLDYLRETTPHDYELATAQDFHRFWLSIRRGNQPDLVLEDAHLIALRIQRDGYTPLVQASEPATFSLIGNSMNMEPTLDEYIARPVSSMPAPSLGYLVLQSWYPNPMAQPRVISNATSWLEAIEMVFAMESEATVAPHNMVSRYVNLAVVQTSDEFPHTSIAASPAVPDAVQAQIRDALTDLHNNSDHFGALHELDIDQFISADDLDYEGLEQWLQDFGLF